MVRVQKFVIFKLFAEHTDIQYVGTSTIGERGIKQTIRNCGQIYNEAKEKKTWFPIFEKGINNIKHEVLEEVENNQQLKDRKKYWQDQIYGNGQPLSSPTPTVNVVKAEEVKIIDVPTVPAENEPKEEETPPLETKKAISMLREYYAKKYGNGNSTEGKCENRRCRERLHGEMNNCDERINNLRIKVQHWITMYNSMKNKYVNLIMELYDNEYLELVPKGLRE